MCIELGHVLIKDGKLAEASFWFSEAGNRRSDNPGLALAHEKLGKAYFDREDYSNAVVEFETAVNIKPEKYDYYYNLGSCYEKLRQWSDAANEYRKLLKIAPEDSLAQQALVRIDKMKQK